MRGDSRQELVLNGLDLPESADFRGVDASTLEVSTLEVSALEAGTLEVGTLEAGVVAQADDPLQGCPAAVVTAALAEAAALGARLVVLLHADPHLPGPLTVDVLHRDGVRGDVLRARLRAELRSPALGAADLPPQLRLLPEPLRAVLAEEPAAEPPVVVPLGGPAGVPGVIVALADGDTQRRDALAAGLTVLGERTGRLLRGRAAAVAAARHGVLLDLLPDAVVALTPDGVVTGWNAGARTLYGIDAVEAVGRPLSDLVRSRVPGPDDRSVLAEVRATGGWRGRLSQTTCHGRVVEADVEVVLLRDTSGTPVEMIALGRDVTEQAARAEATREQERFVQQTLDALGSRAAVLDHRGVVVAANSRWRADGSGRTRCECGPVPVGESWPAALVRAAGPDAAAAATQVAAVLSGRTARARVTCHCTGGGPVHVLGIDLTRIGTGPGGAVVVQADQAEQAADPSTGRRPAEELSFRATHDELTGLPNRAALVDGLTESLERLDGTRKLAVLFCDLDGFKDINDGLGHAVGDQVLVAVARRLRQRCRSADVVARFGGDEFVVVLSIDEVAQAVSMADRIVEVLADPITVGDAEVAPGVSIGITVVDVAPDDEDPVGTLLRDADTAMYHAKGRGRGRYELFDVSLRANIAERLELTAALHRAIGVGSLEVLYQSRRRCGDRAVVGVEALASWQHPTLGRIGPDVFIPIAERTGRIVELGEWVLRTALADLAVVEDQRLSLAVNVSGRQLVGPRLVATVEDALAASGVAAHRLVLEITESAFVDDPEAARAVLTDLRALGVTIALDDFGTGWSSLQYLRRLPVDQLKIDRSFVADLPTDLDACAVVAAVLGLGHGMGMVVVAEGVENLEQLTALREMGCDDYQGFLDGRPGALLDVLGR